MSEVVARVERKPGIRPPQVPADVLRALYEKMLYVYYVEERTKVFVKSGKCSFHASSRGHEKLQICMSMLLQPGKDWFFPYYREKALVVGLGMPLLDVFLGLLAREGDPNSNGRNMSEHFSSRALRVVSPTACTGTQFLPAVGMAKAVVAEGKNEIVYVSSGEGATSEGEFFESLNWACRERLPVLFLVQNNGYAISVPQSTQTGARISEMARGFRLRTLEVDGTRFTEMYTSLKPLVEEMRRNRTPLLVEGHVVRLESHSSSDDQMKYRSADEMEEVRQRDPLRHTELQLQQLGLLTEAEKEALHERIRNEVNGAADAADAQPEPNPASVMEHIYSRQSLQIVEREPQALGDKPITMVEAINRGLREEMERNPKIVMWGEDIADPKGGVFGVTRGLTELFPERVGNSPLAEASIVGVAHGMSIGGYKPVVEIQFGDYIWPGFMQLRNEIPTLRWRSAGAWTTPMVVRVAVGGYIRGGPFHSQSIEALYAHTPGWTIAYPSNAADAKGLIKTACRMDDPVLFMEHKGLYRQVYTKALEPDADYLVPFGRARVERAGADVTVVTWGSGVYRAVQAAKRLEDEAGASVEVLDLRTLMPFDMEAVLASVKRTSKVLVLHEAALTGGFGGEIAARIADEAFEYLDAPVKRIGALDSFVPFAPSLETAVLPAAEQVAQALLELLRF
ncbi:MAG TPA: thiamine pyrophosphate-dependent enzyme [Candidatus Krumholzibacteria bacterium]|nr:thiamine pyrophosphate-dependent enzyme [Candidatus Krumholzibacteria bacterium]